MTTNAHVTWLNMTDDDPAELAAFEAATGTRLHPVAREHLLDSREHELTPFPRIENHGDYLFGMLFVPSDTTNTKDFMKQLNDDENVASNRFTGAIASIMLLPTFIVGLYGQNFDDMPETHWHYGYGFSWMVIVAVTVFQVWFFRRRKWL
jgi:Mg2+ and Co2+ transporter CorA